MHYEPALIDGSSRGVSGRRFQPRVVPGHGGSGPATRCDVHLVVAARAENVVMARHIIGALAETMDLAPMRVEDIKLAVTEACTNVVRHAYPHGIGSLDVAAVADDEALHVVVTDQGEGIRPHAQAEGGPGLGLPLMAAVAHEFEIEHSRAGGTRVRMSFPTGK